MEELDELAAEGVRVLFRDFMQKTTVFAGITRPGMQSLYLETSAAEGKKGKK